MLGTNGTFLQTTPGLPSPTFVQSIVYWMEATDLETLDVPTLSRLFTRVSKSISTKQPTLRQLISGISSIFILLRNASHSASVLNDAVLETVSFLLDASKAQYMHPVDPLEAENLIDAIIRILQKELTGWESHQTANHQVDALVNSNPWVIGLCYTFLARFVPCLDLTTDRWETQMRLLSQTIISLLPSLMLMEKEVGWLTCSILHHTALIDFVTSYISKFSQLKTCSSNLNLVTLVQTCVKLLIDRCGQESLHSNKLIYYHLMEKFVNATLDESAGWDIPPAEARTIFVKESIHLVIKSSKSSNLEDWLCISRLLDITTSQWKILKSLPEDIMELVSCITDILESAPCGGKERRAFGPWILTFLLDVSGRNAQLRHAFQETLDTFYKMDSSHGCDLSERIVDFLVNMTLDVSAWHKTLCSLLLNSLEVYLDSLDDTE